MTHRMRPRLLRASCLKSLPCSSACTAALPATAAAMKRWCQTQRSAPAHPTPLAPVVVKWPCLPTPKPNTSSLKFLRSTPPWHLGVGNLVGHERREFSSCSSTRCAPGPLEPCSSSTGTGRRWFEGKVVVVTGGADGIGRAICLAFASHGATVVCGDVDQDKGQALVDHVSGDPTAYSGSIAFHRFDASSKTDVAGLIHTAVRWSGGIDVLVNNVGVQLDDGIPAHKLDDELFERVMAINCTSYFVAAKHAISYFLEPPCGRRKQGGAIVNMASVQGMMSQPGVPAYAASKGAILSLTRQLAVQYGKQGIRVNSVCPGTIDTPLVRRNIEGRGWDIERAADPYPSGRIGDPSDVAEAVMFLACQHRANFITGALLPVDGGITAIGPWAGSA